MRNPLRAAFLLPMLVLTACPEAVYEDDGLPTDGSGLGDVDVPTADPGNLVYFDCIQVEFRRWGNEFDRCRLEMGFVDADDPSHGEPPRDDEGERDEVRIGECTIEYESRGDGGPGDHGPGPEGPSTGVDVGATLTLRDGDHVVELTRYNPAEGGVLYRLDGCGADNFPFGAVMDLEVPGSDATGIRGFTVSDAVWFPGRNALLAPTVPAEQDGMHACEAGEPLDVEWAADDPEGSNVGSRMNVSVETSEGDRESLRCPIDPADTGVTVPAEAMDTLTGLDDDPAARHDVRLGRTLEGPDTTLPWGPTMRSRVNWEMGGDLSLRGETP